MPPFLSELLGTMLLIIFGGGGVAGVVLKGSKAEASGWLVITFGWGLGVAMAIYTVGRFSGAHIHPAITLALATIGEFPWRQVPTYLLGQFTGAIANAPANLLSEIIGTFVLVHAARDSGARAPTWPPDTPSRTTMTPSTPRKHSS